jgi:Rrf2 family protein
MLLTNRGYQGGYKLAKEPSCYTVGDILRLTEGSLAPVACLENDPIGCEKVAECSTIHMWQGLYKTINEYLDSITIQDIIDNQNGILADNYVI